HMSNNTTWDWFSQSTADHALLNDVNILTLWCTRIAQLHPRVPQMKPNRRSPIPDQWRSPTKHLRVLIGAVARQAQTERGRRLQNGPRART
ncbi:hypothetical protein BDV93DRAFT_524623, partial [Ceratobasidium sp. AG-I]